MDTKAVKRTLVLVAGSVAATCFSSAASAQPFSKAEAILGGPSALERLIAAQNGATVAQAPAPQPASYSYQRPTMVPAVLRDAATVVPAVLRDRPAVSPGVASGRPDIFGTVALRVGHTALDARWHQIEHSTVGGSAAKFAVAQRDKDPVERLEAVNWYVNRRVHFVDDYVQWHRADVWSAASETLSRGKGDCEDFAIAKLAMARRAGFSDKDLYLVILRDTVRRADHAVLVVRAGGHMYVLDNGTDELLDSEAVADYRPILTFASGATFTHGYRVSQPAINIASLDTPPVPGLGSGLR